MIKALLPLSLNTVLPLFVVMPIGYINDMI